MLNKTNLQELAKQIFSDSNPGGRQGAYTAIYDAHHKKKFRFLFWHQAFSFTLAA